MIPDQAIQGAQGAVQELRRRGEAERPRAVEAFI